jgi:hypothetical protein
MTKAATLKVIEGAPQSPPPETPAETPLSPARQALAEWIALRPGLQAEVAAIESAQARLRSLTVAESRAAAAVSALEASLADRALAWARANEQDPPAIGNGGDLLEARELLGKAQAQATAARAAEPQLVAEMERALARRTALEEKIKELVQAVLIEHANFFAARIGSLETEIAAETAKLAALRRPLLRLLGQDVMGGRRAVNAIDLLIGDRRVVEANVRAMEPVFQRLVNELIGNANATLEI